MSCRSAWPIEALGAGGVHSITQPDRRGHVTFKPIHLGPRPVSTALAPMAKLIALFILSFAVVLSAAADDTERKPWHPESTGCFEESLHASIRAWESVPLSPGSLRISTSPDSRGPVIVVALDSGSSPVSAPEGQPLLIGAVGGLTHVCVVRVPADSCSGYQVARARLLSLSVPVGMDMDNSLSLRLHPISYTVETQKSYGLRNRWQSFGNDELASVVDSAIKDLSHCLEPAFQAYGDGF
jgi:hypothetical protein